MRTSKPGTIGDNMEQHALLAADPEADKPQRLSAIAARGKSGSDGSLLTEEELEAAESEAEAWARRVNSC